jgi:hypothetical protein
MRMDTTRRRCAYIPTAYGPIGERLIGILYDLFWAGLNPAIKARIKLLTRIVTGEFESLAELIDKAARAEITPRATPAANQKPRSEYLKRSYRPSISEQPPASSGSSSGSCSGSVGSRALWVSFEVHQERKEQCLCVRCGGRGHIGYNCPTYPRPVVPRRIGRGIS